MDTSERMKKAVVVYYNGKGTTSAPRQGEARTEDNTHTKKTQNTQGCTMPQVIGVGREQANDRRAQYESVSSRGLGPVSDHLC